MIRAGTPVKEIVKHPIKHMAIGETAMRCFIGLPLPESYQVGLQEFIDRWRGRLRSRISWTRPGNWHMTLKFLGEISESVASEVRDVLRDPVGQRFFLCGAGGGFFPDSRSPRVIWAGLGEGGERCRDMAVEIDQRLAGLGLPRERRVFTPHLTLGRVRRTERDPWDELVRDLHGTRWPRIEIAHVVLWASRLTPSGPHYRQIADAKLPPEG